MVANDIAGLSFRNSKGGWEVREVEKALLMELEFLCECSDFFMRDDPNRERIRKWSREFDSVFDKNKDLQDILGRALALPMPHGMIPTHLYQGIVYLKGASHA